MKRLTATRDEYLWSTQGGVRTRPTAACGDTRRKIVSLTDRCTFPRGAPHQLRHCTATLTRPRAARRRVGVPGGSVPAVIRSVSAGSTCVPITSETRRGATGRAQARAVLFASLNVPSNDWVAPCRLPVSLSCPDLQRGSADDDEEAAPTTPSAQQTAMTGTPFMDASKHRPDR